MNLLVLERSTDSQSVALSCDGGPAVLRVFSGADSRSGDWPARVRDFLAGNGLDVTGVSVFAVGLGPGSFAGIRAALAFAIGAALPGGAEVRGIPSAAALSRDGERIAVVGDARRDRFWAVLYDGRTVAKDFFLTDRAGLAAAVPDGFAVTTPDGARMDGLLRETFGPRYLGSAAPSAGRLAEIALADPESLAKDPLPIYLQAAVRS